MVGTNFVTTRIPAERKSEYVPEKLTFFLADWKSNDADLATALVCVGYHEVIMMNMQSGRMTHTAIPSREKYDKLPETVRTLFTNFRPVPADTTITFD